MSHLTLEALARLVDEAPGEAEAAHLEACPACREELVALTEQSQALATLPRMVPAPDAWPAIRRRLREEGILRPTRRWRPEPAMIRAAAAVALFIAGGAAGWAVRGAGVEPDVADVPVATRPAGDATLAADPGPTAQGAGAAPGGTATAEQAEEQFLAALDQFMAAGGGDATDPAARLAALDNIMLTTAEALNEAPSDPIINSYYLMAQAQRRAVLRQIEATAGDPVF